MHNFLWGNYHFLVTTLEGPQCIVDKSSKEILARGRAPPQPFMAMPGFWEHLVTHSLPKSLKRGSVYKIFNYRHIYNNFGGQINW